jgi:hypothetical protein
MMIDENICQRVANDNNSGLGSTYAKHPQHILPVIATYVGIMGVNKETGRKLLSLRNFPDIFGFCGDVTFATQTLSKLTDIADKLGL